MNTRAVLGELREIRRSFEKLIDLIETEPNVDTTDLIDQHKSKLTPRRHCAVVRRRRAEGKPGAFISGRQFLLTPEAYKEELNREPPSQPGMANCEPDNDADDSDEECAYRELRKKMGR